MVKDAAPFKPKIHDTSYEIYCDASVEGKADSPLYGGILGFSAG